MTSYDGGQERKRVSVSLHCLQDPDHLGSKQAPIVSFGVRRVLPVVSESFNHHSLYPTSGIPNRQPLSALDLRVPTIHTIDDVFFNQPRLFSAITSTLGSLLA